MPIHNWTRVSAGTFHAMHVAWIAELQRALNGGVLPEGYYALAEQVAGGPIPDVLALHGGDVIPLGGSQEGGDGPGLAVADAPPRVQWMIEGSEAAILSARRKRIAIRHASGDQIVAFIEIVSPGNIESGLAAQAFLGKTSEALRHGVNLLIIELIPPSGVAPSGVSGMTFEWAIGRTYEPPTDRRLTLAAFAAGETVTAYIEPSAVGRTLVDMPLFLNADHYVSVPLEPTYQAAYTALPTRWRDVIEADGSRM